MGCWAGFPGVERCHPSGNLDGGPQCAQLRRWADLAEGHLRRRDRLAALQDPADATTASASTWSVTWRFIPFDGNDLWGR